AANTNLAIDAYATAAGRSWSRTEFADGATLDSMLPGHDVLLVYEQETGGAQRMNALGIQWSQTLHDFAARGGVIVVCDGLGDSWRILDGAGLMTISSAAWAVGPLTVMDPEHPITASAGSSYPYASSTRSYVSPDTQYLVTEPGRDGVVLYRRYGQPGQAVLIGHDFWSRNADVDALIGNAVFSGSAPGTVRVLAYTQHADLGATGEVANTDAAIDARAGQLGRRWTRTVLADHTLLADSLPGQDVLLVYEQERATGSTMTTVGTAWAPILDDFLDRGGVVIVCDFQGNSHQILSSAKVMDVTRRGTAIGTTTVVDPSNRLALAVHDSYEGPSGTMSFTATGVKVVAVDAGANPVVMTRSFGAPGRAVLIGHDYFASNASVDRLVGNAVFMAPVSGEVRVLAFAQWADLGASGEAAHTDAAISSTAAYYERPVSIDRFTDGTQLGALLPEYDALLIYEQELAVAADMTDVGDRWREDLARFIARGGVVIACSLSKTYNLLNAAGLMEVTSSAFVSTGTTLTIAATEDPLAQGIGASYSATGATYAFGIASGSGLSVVPGTFGRSVVVHRTFAAQGHTFLIGHDYFLRSTNSDRLAGNAVFNARASGVVRVLAYNQYSDNGLAGEAANTNAAIDSVATTLGRSWTRTDLSVSTDLGAQLPGNDVLLVYEQESAGANMSSVASAWAPILWDFVRSGGTLIVMGAGSGGAYQVVSQPALISVTLGPTYIPAAPTLAITDVYDPIAASVSNPYPWVNATYSFEVGNGEIVATEPGGAAIVVHETF
ncbi:MAG: hypothetical protein OEY14_00850, partial [Myxococcales bacterium]|nr:hypothetical protein [Myxococcales bacterium]